MNPFHDKEVIHTRLELAFKSSYPQIIAALRIAKDHTSIPLDMDLVEIAEYEEPNTEAKRKRAAELKKLSTKIKDMLNQPKIKWNTLCITESEAKFIAERLEQDYSSSAKVNFTFRSHH